MVSYPGTVNGSLNVTGNVTVGGTLTSVGNVQADDALSCTNNLSVGGAATIVGVLTAQDGIAVTGGLTVGGKSLVDGFFNLATSPTFTLAAQTATPVTVAVAAGARYLVECAAIFDNTTGVTTVSWTGPAGATMQWVDTTASLDYSSTIGATNNTFVANAGTRMAIFKGNLLIAGTAGSLTLTLGVSAGTTTLRAGSYLRVTQVA